MSLKAIVFDLDDTLYMEKDYVLSGLRSVGEFIQGRFGVADFYTHAEKLYLAGEHKWIFNLVLKQLQIVDDNRLISEMLHIYRNHNPQISLTEDAEWVLQRFAGRVKLGILSDGYTQAQEWKIKALQLNGRFDAIILSDRFGRDGWKPSPVPYQEVSKQLQCRHEECLYVGDNANKDFLTAKILGWTTVHIQRADGVYREAPINSRYEAHYRIESLKQLINIPDVGGFLYKAEAGG